MGPADSSSIPAQPTVTHLSFEEFCELEAAWDDLLRHSPAATPFLSHCWIRCWWKHFGEGQEFLALTVQQGDRLTAAVPLAFRPLRFAGMGVTVAEIVGTGPVETRGMGLSDKADLLFRDVESARPLHAELARLLERVDLVDLKGVDAESPTVAALRATQIPRSVSPYLELPATFDDYRMSRGQKFRKNLKKFRKRLEQKGALEMRRMTEGDDAAAWIDEALTVNDASWKAERGTNLMRAPALRAFFVELAGEMARGGMLDLHILRVAGKAVAYELAFDLDDRIFAYNASFRADYAELSPGTVTTAAVIESACDRGRREYDMLRGGEEYKQRWSATERRELQLLLVGRGVAARAYALFGIRLKARAKQWAWLDRLDDKLSGLRTRARYRR